MDLFHKDSQRNAERHKAFC